MDACDSGHALLFSLNLLIKVSTLRRGMLLFPPISLRLMDHEGNLGQNSRQNRPVFTKTVCRMPVTAPARHDLPWLTPAVRQQDPPVYSQPAQRRRQAAQRLKLPSYGTNQTIVHQTVRNNKQPKTMTPQSTPCATAP